MKKILIIAAFLLVVSPMTVLALGQTTEPIVINNAMRGQQINQEITAVNTENKAVAVIFTADGAIKNWVKFYKPGSLNDPVATTTIAAHKSLSMTAVFSVPADASNGEYKGAVSVTNIPDSVDKKDQSYASIAQKIDRSVLIKVSDKEDINLAASVIPKTYDLQPNVPLGVRIIYDNQSNVSLSPSINFKIKNNDKTLYNVIYPYPEGLPAVNSKAMYEIPALEVPTTNIGSGEYLAQLDFLRGDKVILQKQFGFSIGTHNIAASSQATNFFNNYSDWLLGLVALALLVIIGLFVKKNIDIRQGMKKTIKIKA